ncbi:MAG: LytTR family transcriptional regulator [Gracilimonas sp.]|uniref:LytR/AlgR family response regulator transcription factor n=1 Tax=Gracilimonas TaxID=649462 RepID=UPI001B2CD48B|nr:LytTR family DNA-binding domain-containing protein [Gracilimonas sp.]MBO6586667.1 LytTR family transcriptional regulator [Gracilimonas sp.]MBO6615324.1 LytTR family transcriptional regulator [Gracilimonas sp.]
MSYLKQLYQPIKVPSTGLFSVENKKYFMGFCAFWLFIAFLEFGQDYISSVLQNSAFRAGESLAYKLFWPLFIPFFIALDFGIAKAGERTSGFLYIAVLGVQIIMVTFVHLLVFSVILFGVSILIHDNPMTLLYILFEKLSTRLYIALSVYTALSGLTVYMKRRRTGEKQASADQPQTLTIKNGRSNLVVDVNDIKWISSDGAYLDIFTDKQKHVRLDSLKNIIEDLPNHFKRIHKSTIVNTHRIEELQSRGNGDYDVILDDGNQVRLSRNYADALRGNLL